MLRPCRLPCLATGLVPVLWGLALAILLPTRAGAESPSPAAPTLAPLALVGATLIDGTGRPPIPDAVVVVRDGRIECAGPRADCPLAEGLERLDLAGRFVTPGLIDAHVHFSQTGWADGRPDALDVRDLHPYPEVIAELEERPERFFRALLCSGVTAAFDVGGYPWTFELGHRAEAAAAAPRVAAAGPLLSTLDHWLNLAAERQFIYLEDEEAAEGGVEYLAARGADAVKVWYINASEREPEAMRAAIETAGREAGRHGLPLIVHATELDVAKAALRAGAELLVHSVWDRPVDQELLDLARDGGAIYCPTLTVARGYQRMFEAAASGTAPAVDDPHGCVDAETLARVASTAELGARVDPERIARGEEGTAERERIAADNLKRVADAGVTIAMGTDAGNPLTLHGPSVYAELEAMEAAGMSPMAVLVAATRGGAKAMGREEELGTVEAGKAADLLVLGEDPTRSAAAFRSVERVVRGGEVHAVPGRAASPGNRGGVGAGWGGGWGEGIAGRLVAAGGIGGQGFRQGLGGGLGLVGSGEELGQAVAGGGVLGLVGAAAGEPGAGFGGAVEVGEEEAEGAGVGERLRPGEVGGAGQLGGGGLGVAGGVGGEGEADCELGVAGIEVDGAAEGLDRALRLAGESEGAGEVAPQLGAAGLEPDRLHPLVGGVGVAAEAVEGEREGAAGLGLVGVDRDGALEAGERRRRIGGLEQGRAGAGERERVVGIAGQDGVELRHGFA